MAKTVSKAIFARAGRAGPDDIAERMPELAPLKNASICVIGLGCLGAPSAVEFARCGVKQLRILDHDYVDPATTCRWPLGLQAAGMHKADALARLIEREYPFTEVLPFDYFIGGVRDPERSGISAHAVIAEITDGASLIYDATAEVGIQHYLSDYASERGVPYIALDATPGGWGGRVLRFEPGRTQGCWFCYRSALAENVIPVPPMHSSGEVQPVGCAEPTFTGAGFDMNQIALTGVRTAVSTLCSGVAAGYPAMGWDVTIISLRGSGGDLILPEFRGYQIPRRLECQRCNRT